MGLYTRNNVEDRYWLHTSTSNTYNKEATITGKYAGVDYDGVIPFTGGPANNPGSARYLNANTRFMYIDFDGGTQPYYIYSGWSGTYFYIYQARQNQCYWFLQGYSLTMGKDIHMLSYAQSNTNQGLYSANAPAFHIFGAWEQYDERTLPRNNPRIVIKSGAYGRVILGGSNGVSAQSSLDNPRSHNFIGSSLTDTYVTTCDINITNSTKGTYDFDINLLVGGACTGNTFSNSTLNLVNGSVGRMIGGSIGDSSYRVTGYPVNTYIGTSTLNLDGGSVAQVYGASLGRVMSGNNSCDVYYYGQTQINLAGTNVTGDVYGAGAGAVTGYNSSVSPQNGDNYGATYSSGVTTKVTINMSAGSVGGNIFGGGLGYTEYLTTATIANNGGALYGNTEINISGGTVSGNIFGGGCGDSRNASKPNLATMIGNSVINITGSPTINGDIYGAGNGLQNNNNVAKFTGTTTINVNADLTHRVFGGGNYAQTVSPNQPVTQNGVTTYPLIATINLNSGNHTGNIYGGGNLAILDGATLVNIDGTVTAGTINQNEVYGGGKSAEVKSSTVNIKNGTTNKVFGGGEAANVIQTQVNMTGGVIKQNIYGGSNTSGTVNTSNVVINNGTIHNDDNNAAIYGGNNAGGSTNTANVTFNDGTADYIFGGGNKATTTTTNVLIANGTINENVFGGGNEASTSTTNLTLKGGIAHKAFGGGNQAGVTTVANVTGYSGTYEEIYGGSNTSGNVTKSVVRIKAPSEASNPAATGNQVYGDVYGGNNVGGITQDPNVYMDNGTVTRIFGGGNQAQVPKTNVVFTNGTATEVYAGGNGSTARVTGANGTKLVVHNGTITGAIYGGGNQAPVSYNTDVTVNGGIINKAFGGGNSAVIDRSTSLTINSGKITQSFGGGNQAGVTTSTKVYLYGGKLYEVYGGSNQSGNVALSNVYLYEPQHASDDANYTDFDYPDGAEVDDNADGIPDKYEFEGVDLREYNIKFVFGGNNAGGTTQDPNVTISGGKAGNVIGGGNSVSVPKTNVVMSSGQIGNIFGGGNRDSVNNNTLVDINGGTVDNNVYGGGNAGVVGGNTTVTITNAAVKGSAFAGGNGAEAIVAGNSIITVDGSSIIGTDASEAPKKGSVFGGGNAAGTGVGTIDPATGKYHGTSTTSVNIAGGTIYGNVYGGPYGGTETTKVYGSTGVYIGLNAISNAAGLNKDTIYIVGTIFGGGEANISGGSSFSSAFTSVTDGLEMIIDGTGYDQGGAQLDTTGSIFGSGNASHTEGSSNITIRNYGTLSAPKDNISIQRTTNLIIENSGILLKGTTDSTNDYADEEYSINRVENLYLCNNSTLYLNRGANLLQNWNSLVSVPTTTDGDGKFIITNLTEVATIKHYQDGVETNNYLDETGKPIETLTTHLTSQNIDNRIYLKEGITLNIAKNQDTSYAGGVNGMTYVGLFTDINSPATSVGQYSPAYGEGQTITNMGTFTKNATIKGEHKANHDIGIDGFYTTLNNDEKAKFEYVGVDPLDQDYYYWYIGENIDVTIYEITLQASKYATLGTGELLFDKHTAAGARFTLQGVTVNMEPGKNLVKKSTIPAIAPTDAEANSNFGLAMKNGKKGIVTNGNTHFYVEETNGVPVAKRDGTQEYVKENSSIVPSFEFYLYHSQNITQKEDLGVVTIRIQCRYNPTPTTVEYKLIDVVATLKSELFVDPAYETAITPGKEFELFTSTVTNVTNDGEFSNYFSLNITDFKHSDYYSDFATYKRYFISRDVNGLSYPFKAGTTFTMLDLVTNSTYYYVVTQADETAGKFRYDIEDFIKMGSTNEMYDAAASQAQYIVNEEDADDSNDYVFEEYIIHVNFESANITTEAIGNTFFMELLNDDYDTIIGTLEPEKSNNYSVFVDKAATIEVNADLEKNIVYLGETDGITVTSNFTQPSIGGNIIYDTKFLDQKMGMRIVIKDSNDNQLSSSSLVGLKFVFDGVNYYPRYDGSTRINIAEKVSNALTNLRLDLTDNTILSTGTYQIIIEVFGSADGIYYGDQNIGIATLNVDIISGDYGLKVFTEDHESKIVKGKTGTVSSTTLQIYDTAETANTGSEVNEIPIKVQYASSLDNAQIIVGLQRRVYSQSENHSYDLGYTAVDLMDYVDISDPGLTEFGSGQYLYVFNDDPEIPTDEVSVTYTHRIKLKNNLTTGTYRIVYSIYDGDTFIGDEFEYIVIN